IGDDTGNRREIDDRAVARTSFDERARGIPTTEQDRADVDAQDAVDVLRRDLEKRHAGDHSGALDEDVDGPDLRLELRECPLDLVGAAEIGEDRDSSVGRLNIDRADSRSLRAK